MTITLHYSTQKTGFGGHFAFAFAFAFAAANRQIGELAKQQMPLCLWQIEIKMRKTEWASNQKANATLIYRSLFSLSLFLSTHQKRFGFFIRIRSGEKAALPICRSEWQMTNATLISLCHLL